MQASNAAVQQACLDAMHDDPEVYSAFGAMADTFAAYGIDINRINPVRTAQRLAIEGVPDGNGAAEAQAEGPRPLQALIERIEGMFESVGGALQRKIQLQPVSACAAASCVHACNDARSHLFVRHVCPTALINSGLVSVPFHMSEATLLPCPSTACVSAERPRHAPYAHAALLRAAN
jgi:hypothetical protein